MLRFSLRIRLHFPSSGEMADPRSNKLTVLGLLGLLGLLGIEKL